MASLWILSILAWVYCCSAFNLVHDYSGPHFFDDWDFFGSWDNLTLGESDIRSISDMLLNVSSVGDVWWLNASDAFSQRLAYVNDAGNAILKVDNTSNVPFNEKRNTVSTIILSFVPLP